MLLEHPKNKIRLVGIVGFFCGFIGVLAVISAAEYYPDGNETWKISTCLVLQKDTQKIRYGYRAIFEVRFNS